MTESELRKSMLDFIEENEDDSLMALIDDDSVTIESDEDIVNYINEHYTTDDLACWIQDIINEKCDSLEWMYEEGREAQELINEAKQFV